MITLPPQVYEIGDACVAAKPNWDWGGDMRVGEGFGNDRFGLSFETGVSFRAQGAHRGLDTSTFQVLATADHGPSATLMGHEVKIIGLDAKAGIGMCGAGATFGLTLFGKHINLGGVQLGQAVDALTDWDQLKADQMPCLEAADQMDKYADRLKKSMLDAVEVYHNTAMSADPVLTPEFCRVTATEFSAPLPLTGGGATADGRRVSYLNDSNKNGSCDPGESCGPSFIATHLAGDIENCDDPDFWTDGLAQALVQRWLDDYALSLDNYNRASANYLSKTARIKGRFELWSSTSEWESAGWDDDDWFNRAESIDNGDKVFGTEQVRYREDKGLNRFTVYPIEVHYKAGPFDLLLLVEPTGFWGVPLTIEYKAETPLAAAASPTTSAAVAFTPRLGAEVTVFAGVGVEFLGASVHVGLEGTLTLIDARTPIMVGVGLTRPGQKDTRPIHGDLLPQLSLAYEPLEYKWRLEHVVGAGLKIDILSGRLDLAVRFKIWRWKKHKSWKLASFPPVATKHYEWLGTLAAPTVNSPELAWTRREVTYPEVPTTDYAFLAPLDDGYNGGAAWHKFNLDLDELGWAHCLPSLD